MSALVVVVVVVALRKVGSYLEIPRTTLSLPSTFHSLSPVTSSFGAKEALWDVILIKILPRLLVWMIKSASAQLVLKVVYIFIRLENFVVVYSLPPLLMQPTCSTLSPQVHKASDSKNELSISIIKQRIGC